MSKSHGDLLANLKSQQSKLEEVAKLLPVVPEEMKRFSEEIKDVISAVGDARVELHDVDIGVKALRLESDRKSAVTQHS